MEVRMIFFWEDEEENGGSESNEVENGNSEGDEVRNCENSETNW
jgi:hypothetical protein